MSNKIMLKDFIRIWAKKTQLKIVDPNEQTIWEGYVEELKDIDNKEILFAENHVGDGYILVLVSIQRSH